ncbi:MAG: TRAM domain-containing protein, partial [Anaerovoracaceae bacterium]
HERFNRLVESINEISLRKNKEYIGKVVSVLCEGKSKNREEVYQGRSETNKIVNFKSEIDHTGEILQVQIVSANTFSLQGDTL